MVCVCALLTDEDHKKLQEETKAASHSEVCMRSFEIIGGTKLMIGIQPFVYVHRAILTEHNTKARRFHRKKLLDRSFLRFAHDLICTLHVVCVCIVRLALLSIHYDIDGEHGIFIEESVMHMPHKKY